LRGITLHIGGFFSKDLILILSQEEGNRTFTNVNFPGYNSE
jgi:hypothetical protein